MAYPGRPCRLKENANLQEKLPRRAHRVISVTGPSQRPQKTLSCCFDDDLWTSSHPCRILDHSALELNRSCAKGFLDEGPRVHFRGLDPPRFCTTCIDVFGVSHYVLYDFWANIFFRFLFPHVFMLDFCNQFHKKHCNF